MPMLLPMFNSFHKSGSTRTSSRIENKYKYQFSNIPFKYIFRIYLLRYFSSSKSLAILLLREIFHPDSANKTTPLLFLFINYQNESSLSDNPCDDNPFDNSETMENTLVAIKRAKQVNQQATCKSEVTEFPLTWVSYSSVFFSESVYVPNCNTYKK